MKYPNIAIESQECPDCGEKTGIVFNFTGPAECEGERFTQAVGKIICKHCKRQWNINLLLQLEENKIKEDN